MKRLVTLLTLAVLTACPLAGFGQSDIEKDPAFVSIDKLLDLKVFPPQVNVNLPRFLLKDALAGLTNSSEGSLESNKIDLADLVKDVKLIRVVVIQANQTNRTGLETAMKRVSKELDAKWTPIVTVPENNVGVYAMGDASGDSVAGLAVTVFDGGNAVVANVVGHISIGKLIKIAAQSKKLPKGLLEQLQGFSNPPGAGTDSKPEKEKDKMKAKKSAPAENSDGSMEDSTKQ